MGAAPSPSSDLLDARALRTCLGRFASGVAVVTMRGADGRPHGITVSSFTSVSLDPPVVLVSIQARALANELLRDRPFTVNVLGADQLAVAWHFAGKPDPALAVDWVEEAGIARLRRSNAFFVCAPWRRVEAGDHVLYLGRVGRFDGGGDRAPLLFHGSRFHSLGSELTG